jgi:hypothetical protein
LLPYRLIRAGFEPIRARGYSRHFEAFLDRGFTQIERYRKIIVITRANTTAQIRRDTPKVETPRWARRDFRPTDRGPFTF